MFVTAGGLLPCTTLLMGALLISPGKLSKVRI
jgi:hypothetical protein